MGYSKKAMKPKSQSNIDYNALNKQIIEVVGKKPQSQIYHLVGIVDLGNQEQQNFEEPYDENNKDHQDALNRKENPATIVIGKDRKTGKPVDMISIPQYPKDQVAFILDFPELIIDWDKVTEGGEGIGKKPFRYIYGGTFYTKETGPIVARGINMTCVKNPKAPSGAAYTPTNMVSKFAIAAGLANDDNIVDQEFDIGELLGTFGGITLGLKVTEKGEKVYVNPFAKDPAPLYKGVPKPDTDIEPFGVSWGGDNDPEVLKQLNVAIKNTIKRANNYEGSAIQAELEALEGSSGSNPKQTPSSNEKTSSAPSQEDMDAFADDEPEDKVSESTLKKEEPPFEPDNTSDDDDFGFSFDDE